MLSGSWNHNRMATNAAKMPLYTINASSDRKLLAVESNVVPDYRLPSFTRHFSTISNIFRNILRPNDEANFRSLKKNSQTQSDSDILTDKNIKTPIFETPRGNAKLRIPEEKDTIICDHIKSLSVGNSPYDLCPIASEPNKMDSRRDADSFLKSKIRKRAKMTNDSKFPITNGSLNYNRSQRTANRVQNKAAIKNREQKNRHIQLVNIMEDILPISDESESDVEAGSYCSSQSDITERFNNSTCNQFTQNFQPSDEMICSLISNRKNRCSLNQQNTDQTLSCTFKDDDSFVFFPDNVKLTTPSTTPSRRKDLCTAINSFFIPGGISRRQRQVSECSDESIVFCYDSDDSVAAIDFGQNSDSEETDSDEQSDNDICDGPLSQQPDSGFEDKKVRFNPKPEVHVMRMWDFAYRQARKGDWEMAARDRERFKKRIEETGRILTTVFDERQRDRIFLERFNS